MSIHTLPTLNALLNATSAVLLALGYRFIRRREVQAHRACMVAAFIVSVCFLTSYLIYHYHVRSVHFPWTGWVHGVYSIVLTTHIILAFTVPPLAIVTLYRGLSARFDRHRRIARWTLPIWFYVSITGVIVYWMLYHLAGAHAL
jgi:putative membrane protein